MQYDSQCLLLTAQPAEKSYRERAYCLYSPAGAARSGSGVAERGSS